MEGRNLTETQILMKEGNHKNRSGINIWKEIKTRKQKGGKTDKVEGRGVRHLTCKRSASGWTRSGRRK